jgi:hypothetical protein
VIDDSAEDLVWKTIDPDDIWVLDKLILSRKLEYTCGPVGLDVPSPGYYIVRPCVNMLGLGLGAQRVWLEQETMHLPLGHFWCEWFEGRHLSIDYHWGTQVLAVEGHKSKDTFTRWSNWQRVDDVVLLPDVLKLLANKHQWINCEFIGGKLIEVHFRYNEDFVGNINHFIPVWEDEIIDPPKGYRYREYPDVHGRKGAYIR